MDKNSEKYRSITVKNNSKLLLQWAKIINSSGVQIITYSGA